MKKMLVLTCLAVFGGLKVAPAAADDKASPTDNMPPPGFTALFNGKDLTGWQGLIEIHKRAKMSKEERDKAQKLADEKFLPHWKVKDGVIVPAEPLPTDWRDGAELLVDLVDEPTPSSEELEHWAREMDALCADSDPAACPARTNFMMAWKSRSCSYFCTRRTTVC